LKTEKDFYITELLISVKSRETCIEMVMLQSQDSRIKMVIFAHRTQRLAKIQLQVLHMFYRHTLEFLLVKFLMVERTDGKLMQGHSFQLDLLWRLT